MSLFSSHTIFNLLITLIIGVALYYYMKYKFRILELTQREHAKVLQSVIMSMDKGSSGRGFCMENQTGGESMCMNMNNLQNLDQDMNRFREINKNELIDVSDEDDNESDDESSNTTDSDTDSSESGSDSDSDVDVEEDHIDDSCNTKKIVITNSHDLHKVEHLTGPDIKVIELTHPLYPSNENVDKAHIIELDHIVGKLLIESNYCRIPIYLCGDYNNHSPKDILVEKAIEKCMKSFNHKEYTISISTIPTGPLIETIY